MVSVATCCRRRRRRRHRCCCCCCIVHNSLTLSWYTSTTTAIEILEGILWSQPQDLVPVENSTQQTCSLRNKCLTLIAWLFIIFWQPYFAIFACRRGGRHRNWTLLEVPEKLSLLFGMSMIASYLYTITSAKTALLRTLADSDYLSYLNTETCTYLGRGGHFHWTLASADSFIVPNSYTYALLWFSCSFARPLRLFSGILFFGLVLFMMFLVELGGSFEAGSVWCWSAIILILYITVQPYLLPIHDCGRSNDNTQHEKPKSITSRVSFSSNAKMTV